MLPRPTTRTLTLSGMTPSLFACLLRGGRRYAQPASCSVPARSALDCLIERVRLDVLVIAGCVLVLDLVAICIGLHLGLVEAVGPCDQVVAADVFRLHGARDLPELQDAVEEGLPARHVVPAPALAFIHVT